MEKKYGIAGCCVDGSVPCQPAAPPAAAAPPDYAATLGPVVEQFWNVWNTQNCALLDSITAPDFKRVAPDFNANSPAEWEAGVKQAHAAYPDFLIVTDNAAFSANHALLRWTVTGTYTVPGGAKGAAKPVSVTGMTMLTFRDGKIIEEDGYYDTAGLDAQTGTKAPPHVKPAK